MFPAQALSVDDLLPLLTRDVIEAIADRPRESEARRQARAQGAMRLIEALEPEDGVEIMLAGQTVLMQNLLLDSVHDAHRATTVDDGLRHRQQAMAMGRMQLAFLKEISRHRADRPRPVEEVPAQSVAAPPPRAAAPAAAPPRPEAPAAAPPRSEVPAAVPPRPQTEPALVAQPVPPPADTPKPAVAPVQVRPAPPMPPPSGAARPGPVMTGT
jgi:hypothetical protein